MSRRDWGRPGLPWYAKREADGGRLASADARARLKAYFERNGSLYGGTRNPLAQDADRPDPGECCEVLGELASDLRTSDCPEWEASLADIGRALGVSRERIRNIEAGALIKLREELERRERDAEFRMLRDRLRRSA